MHTLEHTWALGCGNRSLAIINDDCRFQRHAVPDLYLQKLKLIPTALKQ